jgi:hypothetical protein
MTSPVTVWRPVRWLPVVAGVGVAVGLGVYGRLHDAAALSLFGDIGRPILLKAALTSGVATLAVVQLISAFALYGRLPSPPWTAVVHRWSGRLAVLVSVPVAVHCLYALGFQFDSPRVLAHSLLGCLFYGAFVAKMLVLGSPAPTRGWVLPLAGGLVFTALVGIWLTAALWFFLT